MDYQNSAPTVHPVDPSPAFQGNINNMDAPPFPIPTPFPVPMEYAPGSTPPPYTGMDPFDPRAQPQGGDSKKLTAEDLKPGHDSSLELIGRSIKEMEDCKVVFDGLLEGIGKRCSKRSTDNVEKDIHERVLALSKQSDSVLESCSFLRQSTRAFIEECVKKLGDIVLRGGGSILPDEGLKKKGGELIRASNDMSEHVALMLQKLQDLVTFVQSKKESGKSSLQKKIWDWLVRAFNALKKFFLTGTQAVIAPVGLILGTCVASHTFNICKKLQPGCKEEEGLGTVLEFLQSHLPEDAKKAEANLKNFAAQQMIFRSPLGVGSAGGIIWMDEAEVARARNDWYHALVTFDKNAK